MLFRKPSRPFDPTGRKLQNLVMGEIRPLDKDEKYVFVPSHGPFFSESLVVRHGGRYLTRDKDYQVLILHKQATMDIGSEVGVCIRINDTSLPEISIDYQAVGGTYVDLVDILRSIREGFGDKLLKPIRWADIIGKPTSYNPSAHYHPVWDVDGWEGWINSLDGVRQALLYIDHKKYQAGYDYALSKFNDIVHSVDIDIARIRNKLKTTVDELIPSVGAMRLSTKKSSYTDGVWVDHNKDTLLFAVSKDVDIGKEWMLSIEPTGIFPDNVILDEDDAYLLQDNNEWIYRDNEFPADGKGGSDDYWEDVDEQFNATTVKLYRLQSLNPVHSHTLTANVPSINESDVVLFKVNTVGYPTGTAIIYQLTGIGSQNVNVPLIGTFYTNIDGVATLAVQLLHDSPRTDNDQMTFRTTLDATKSVSCEYFLMANFISDLGLRYVVGLSDLPVNKLIQGDTFKVKVLNRGAQGKTIRLCSNIPAGIPYTVNGTNTSTDGNREMTLRSPQQGENVQYTNISLGFNNDTPTQNVQFWLIVDGHRIDGDMITLSKRDVNIDFINLDGEVVNQGIRTETPFRIRVKHQGRHLTPFSTTISATPISDQLEPTTPAKFYTNSDGYGLSDILIVRGSIGGNIDFMITGDNAVGTVRKSLPILGEN